MTEAQNAGMPRHRYSIPMYIGAGFIATGSHYVTTIALVELLAVAPIVASGGGFAVGALVKYWLNYVVVFRSRQGHTVAVPRFILMLGILFLMNLGAFALYQQGLGLHYMVAQVLTTGTIILPGYLISRLWVYRHAER